MNCKKTPNSYSYKKQCISANRNDTNFRDREIMIVMRKKLNDKKKNGGKSFKRIYLREIKS